MMNEWYVDGTCIPDMIAAEVRNNAPKKKKVVQMRKPVKNAKHSKHVKPSKDAKKPKKVKQAKNAKQVENAKHSKQAKQPKKIKQPKQPRTQREIEIEIMQLIGQRDRLRIKLSELNPGKNKDAKKIVHINIMLKEIEERITVLQQEGNIVVNSLDHGSRFERFVSAAREKVHRIKKKIHRFYKTYKDSLLPLIAAAIPLVISGIVKIITGLIV